MTTKGGSAVGERIAMKGAGLQPRLSVVTDEAKAEARRRKRARHRHRGYLRTVPTPGVFVVSAHCPERGRRRRPYPGCFSSFISQDQYLSRGISLLHLVVSPGNEYCPDAAAEEDACRKPHLTKSWKPTRELSTPARNSKPLAGLWQLRSRAWIWNVVFDQMPGGFRKALFLHDGEDYSHPEIAEFTGWADRNFQVAIVQGAPTAPRIA